MRANLRNWKHCMYMSATLATLLLASRCEVQESAEHRLPDRLKGVERMTKIKHLAYSIAMLATLALARGRTASSPTDRTLIAASVPPALPHRGHRCVRGSQSR